MSAEDVEEWLLPASRRPRRTGNLVTPIVHGANYFARLVEVVSAAGAGDLVWFTDCVAMETSCCDPVGRPSRN